MKIKKIIKVIAISLLAFLLVVHPLATVIVYESIFSGRHETEQWRKMDADDFEGLQMERADFDSSERLAGYKYSKNTENPCGVVVIAHGMGGGGHNKFLPYIDIFTDWGYYVFAYDAQGTDNSEGDGVGGFPQGAIDLDNALKQVKSQKEYKGLPIMLFGHSWGAYSIGCVLNIHKDIKAAVMVAGFNDTETLLGAHASKYVGFFADVLMPTATAYEWIKYGGEYSGASVIEGIESSDTSVLIVQSRDDKTVICQGGYDLYYESFKNEKDVSFVLYDDRGHSGVLFSKEAVEYQSKLLEEYESYIDKTGKDDCQEVKNEFMKGKADPKKYYEPNSALLEEVYRLFSSVN